MSDIDLLIFVSMEKSPGGSLTKLHNASGVELENTQMLTRFKRLALQSSNEKLSNIVSDTIQTE